jgi:uncharacterized protein YjiS (DUF1127 family)
MRHERFEKIFGEIARVAEPATPWPNRLAGWLADRLAPRRADLRDFSDAQLRDIGLSRSDIERF